MLLGTRTELIPVAIENGTAPGLNLYLLRARPECRTASNHKFITTSFATLTLVFARLT